MPQTVGRLSTLALVVLVGVAGFNPGYAAQGGARKSRTAPVQKQKPAYRDFKIPAGTALTIQLSTTAASDTSHPDDAVVGRLSIPLSIDGTELVPVGTPVFGRVILATAANREDGPGRLELTFNLIEHPETKSRVGIRTTSVRFQGELVKTKRRGFTVTRPTDVRVQHGDLISATLLEPFVVRLPIVE